MLPSGALGQGVTVKTTTSTDSRATGLFARDAFKIDPIVCPFKGKIDYEPGEIECGLLKVPENREASTSRMIELMFVKLHANKESAEADESSDDNGVNANERSAEADESSDDNGVNADEGSTEADESSDDNGLSPGRRADPVIYLTGGPGVGTFSYVKRFKDHGIRKHRDLYILEQRGIANSGDFCPFYATRSPALSNAETFTEDLKAGIMKTEACLARAQAHGVDLRGYNTIENARDVHALRLALGFEQWNVWGISYGSVLGQAYVREDPQGIRAVVLDAIMPLFARDDAEYWRVINWYIRDLKKLDEACQDNRTCKSRYPNLAERIRTVARSMDGQPITVEVKDTETYPSGKAYFFKNVGAMLPFLFLYEQKTYSALPGIIYAWADILEEGDPELLKGLTAGGMPFQSSEGMRDALFCNDGFIDSLGASVRADIAEHPTLGGVAGTVATTSAAAALCRSLGLSPRPAEQYAMVESDIPALIVEGAMDPITPPPLAKAILPGFKNGTYVEFPYAGHGPSRSVKCAGDMLNKFYDNPTSAPDLSCAEQMEAPDFYWLYPSKAAFYGAAMATGDKKAFLRPAIWGGVSLLVLVVAFIMMTLSPIGRWIDGKKAAATHGARLVAWLAATLSVAGVAVIGAGGVATFKQYELLLLFGMVSWARYGVIAVAIAGVLGLVTVALVVRARMRNTLPIGTLIGLFLTGAAAVSLSVFFFAWDLGPF